MKWGGLGTGDGQFSHATGIAVDGQGNVFVSDYENQRVQKFNAQGEFMLAWRMGEDVGVTGIPEGIAVDAQGRVYVTDYLLGRLQVFSNDGEFLWAWGVKSITKSLFKQPVGIALDSNTHVYVVNQAGNNVQVFNLP